MKTKEQLLQDIEAYEGFIKHLEKELIENYNFKRSDK